MTTLKKVNRSNTDNNHNNDDKTLTHFMVHILVDLIGQKLMLGYQLNCKTYFQEKYNRNLQGLLPKIKLYVEVKPLRENVGGGGGGNWDP